MKRRSAVQRIAFIVGGSLWLPSCLPGSEKKSGDALNETVLADWVDWLIPKTDVPGAEELGVHHFVTRMIADCYDKNTQEQVQKDLQTLADYGQKETGVAWNKISKQQKNDIFMHFSRGENGELSSFSIIRQKAIQGYMNSEYIMTKVFPYEMAPGRYNGYYPATKA